MQRATGPLAKAIQGAVSETFENMAFIEAFRNDAGAGLGLEDATTHWARLEVETPVKGNVLVYCTARLVDQIGTAVFGGLPDDLQIKPVMMDVISEVLNTIAGRLMMRMVPGETTFTLGVPQAGMGKFQKSEDMHWDRFEIESDFFCVLVDRSIADYAQANPSK